MSAIRPRIDTVSLSFFRKGKCARCGGSVERTKTFTGTSMTAAEERGARWGDEPLKHKRCEGFA